MIIIGIVCSKRLEESLLSILDLFHSLICLGDDDWPVSHHQRIHLTYTHWLKGEGGVEWKSYLDLCYVFMSPRVVWCSCEMIASLQYVRLCNDWLEILYMVRMFMNMSVGFILKYSLDILWSVFGFSTSVKLSEMNKFSVEIWTLWLFDLFPFTSDLLSYSSRIKAAAVYLVILVFLLLLGMLRIR